MKPLLFVVSQYHPVVGGTEVQAALLARALASRGQPVEVLTCALPGLATEELVDGVRVHRRIRLVRRHGLWALTHFAGSFGFLLRQRRHYRAVVGFQLQAFHTPAASLWARLGGGRFVIRTSGAGPTGDLAETGKSALRRLVLAAARRADAVVALGGELQAQFVAAGFDPRRVVAVPNAVDTKLFHPPESPDRAGFVFVGRLVAGKGVDVVVEAVRLLRASGVCATTTVVGEGPERGRLEALARSLGLERDLEFRGRLGRLEVAAALRRAVALVLPSLEEGMSNTLLEAMASGCTVVASDIAANRQLVDDEASGLLVPPGAAAALAAAMSRVLQDRPFAEKLAAAALDRVRDRHVPAVVADRWLELLARLESPGGA